MNDGNLNPEVLFVSEKHSYTEVGIATLRTITTRLQICPNVLHQHPMFEIKPVVSCAQTSKRIYVPFFLDEP